MRALIWHRPLLLLAAVTTPFIVISIVGLVVDDRVLAGAPIWLKPFKFAVSIVIYAVTWSWLMAYLPNNRLTRWSATAIAVILAIEYVIIVGQVLRGRHSHFNVATPLDAVLWGTMGTSIALLWIANLVLAFFLLRQQIGDSSVTWAVRAGTVISLAGIAVAFLMTGPTPEQLASVSNGTFAGIIGGHSVGVADGGPIMPVTGWSTTGGDLRIPHFIGIHALQALPLLALALATLATRTPVLRSETVRTRLVLVTSAGYAGLTGLTLWQALRGQPVIQPDGLTLLAGGVLVALVAAGAIAAMASDELRRRRRA
jgi:hypothetical protein